MHAVLASDWRERERRSGGSGYDAFILHCWYVGDKLGKLGSP